MRGFGFEPFSRLGINGTIQQYRCLECDFRFFDDAEKVAGDGEFYNELSSRFAWYYEKDKWEFDAAVDVIRDNSNVRSILEVGCGFGHFLRRMQSLCDVKGLEFNPHALEYCASIGIDVSNEAMEEMQDESFDLVCAFEVLEHLPHPHEFISQSVRLLRRGGILIFAVPDPHGYFEECDRVLLDMPPHHVNGFSKKSFEAIAKRHDLDLVTILQEPLRYAHYKSYVSGLLPPPQPPRQLMTIERIVRRIFGYRTILDTELAKVSEKLTEAVVAASFQGSKDKMLGQTHLVVFSKSKST